MNMGSISSPQDHPDDWAVKAARKYAECQALIPKSWRIPSEIMESLQAPLEANPNDLITLDVVRRSGILSERELDITEKHSVESLLNALATGSFTSEEVTVAFSKRAALAQQLTNCLTEMMFDDARIRARELDALRESGKLAGPLHGLPISIKDSFQVAGTQATLGLVAYLDRHSEKNSSLVEILLSLGAVLYVKTNIPQTMMTADSQNNVFRRTLNPRNTMLGAGGSSGGEGALIAFRGSPLGVGTDIAGSIRIPALCCGTYGFKPTANRVPYGGQQGCSTPGLKFIPACAGPLANDFAALEIFVKNVIDARPSKFDHTVIDVPWRVSSLEPKQKLRLGVLPESETYPLHPPIRAALLKAVRKLESQGHELVRLDSSVCHVDNATEVAWGLFGLDNGADKVVSSSGEPVIPSRTRIATQIKRVNFDFVPTREGEDQLSRIAALNVKKAEILDAWRMIWNDNQLDAVIGPGAQNTAVEHDLYGVPPYTTLLNVLDYPACVIPFGKSDELSGESLDFQPHQAGPPYNPTITKGMPCSVQVFTSSMRDEECLAISKIVNTCLKEEQSSVWIRMKL
ncbi:amidase signature domain-containing protein [Dactylonectria macrodidyma]|uniref:amidase n=1 Tax=Dactylonectria macrodidyma TaxID=307937 RepID=A0A9P9DMG3_9HYPO|nr:amidase signature domain-containing protein [Dactylonectria macrodidyma]